MKEMGSNKTKTKKELIQTNNKNEIVNQVMSINIDKD